MYYQHQQILALLLLPVAIFLPEHVDMSFFKGINQISIFRVSSSKGR